MRNHGCNYQIWSRTQWSHLEIWLVKDDHKRLAPLNKGYSLDPFQLIERSLLIFIPDWESQEIMSNNCQIWSRSQWSHLEIWLVKDDHKRLTPLNKGYSIDPLQLIERSPLIFLPDWESQEIMSSNCQIWSQSQWSHLEIWLVKDDHKKTRNGATKKLHEKLSRKLLEKLELASDEAVS